MYCSNCAAPITSTLSYCNRCGASLRQTPQPTNTGAMGALLTTITLIAICGMAMMLGGGLALKAAGFNQDFIAVFMILIFMIVGATEFVLLKNVSKLLGSSAKQSFQPTQQPPLELRPPNASNFVEPVASVTDNTTRTLEYARREN